MKKILFIAFAAVFASALSVMAQAAVTCGTPGTEGMPSCSTVSGQNQACCIPPYYKGSKSVAKPGTKTTSNKIKVSKEAASAEISTVANNNAPADFSHAQAVSVKTANQAVAAQTAPAQTATGPSTPSTPATPAAPAASASSAVKSASSAKAAK